ncbi:MAG: hypothetical protein EBT43_02120 [Methylocystaceae bacterium]|nr:hypothetical protein [Methylocystaceae bacterium]
MRPVEMHFFCFFSLQTQFFFHSVNSKILSVVTAGVNVSKTLRACRYDDAREVEFMRGFSTACG